MENYNKTSYQKKIINSDLYFSYICMKFKNPLLVVSDMDISVKEISQEEENGGMYPDIQRLMNSGVKVDIL